MVSISQYSRSLAAIIQNARNSSPSTGALPKRLSCAVAASARPSQSPLAPPESHLLARGHQVLFQQVRVVRLGDRNAGVPEVLDSL